MNLLDQLDQILKRCSRCGDSKVLSEFTKLKRSRDGHDGVCRNCKLIGKRAWLAANKERREAKAKQWRESHPERIREIARKSYRKRAQQISARSRAKRQADPSIRFRAHLKEKFNLTLAEHQALVDAQNGLCAICAQPPSGRRNKLVVDHDHESGKIRGLLCDTCNRALGLFKDDADVLQKAVSYLAAHRFKLKAA